MKLEEIIEHINECINKDLGENNDYSVEIGLYLKMFDYENDAYNELYSRIKQKQRAKEDYEKNKNNQADNGMV
jgi:hypothetical protein